MAHTFKIRQIYLKDASFQAPGGAAAFTQTWAPEVKVDIRIGTDQLAEHLYEVSLTLAVVTRTAGQTAFMIEVVHGGVFTISGYDDGQVHRILHTVCPDMLYPYARETIDGLVSRGRFPALMLEPVDFGATYQAP
jgi:preprotein translocase subunit SecB